MEAALPAYTGVNLPFPGEAGEEAPLTRLVRKIYASPEYAGAGPLPTFAGSLDLFPKAHEDAILREPFRAGGDAATRPCLMGDSCVGKNPLIPGHAASGGVILMEVMSPAELVAFRATGAPPAERRTCLLCARYNVHSAYLFTRKQRTFPPNAHLNHYVNASGEGEYSAEYLIPAADDSSWSGVVGTVVGLHLNALRLVQDPDKTWRVNQDAMSHVTRTPCNVTFAPLYRSLVPEPQMFLRTFFTHRARVTDAPILFFSYEELCEARPKLGAPPTDAYMKWPHAAVKSFRHRLLFYRVNRLNVMLEECSALYGRTWAYNMQLYIDAHIGMALVVERGEALTSWALKYTAHEHALPDLLSLCVQAAVNSVVPEGLSVVERKRELAKPRAVAAQMLIRALPEFSQTRWLHALFLRGLHNRELSATMFQLMQAAMLGNYTHVTGPPAPYATRKAIVAEFNLASAVELMTALPSNEPLVLYIMGTYLLTILPLCPALEKLVVAMSPFQSHAGRVFESMQAVRHAGRDDWRLMFSREVLETLKKTHKRMPKRKLIPRGLADCSTALLTSAVRTAARRGLKRGANCVAFDPSVFAAHLKRARSGEPPRVEGADAAATELLAAWEADPSRPPSVVFSDITDDGLMCLVDAAAAVDHAQLTRAVPLPADFVRAQVAAVARRFSCAEDDWDTLRRATRVLVCVSCGVRNFVLSEAERAATGTRRLNCVRASGYKRLAVDLEKDEMFCVAGDACSKHKLTAVDLAGPGGAGGALVLRGQSLLISPCCGFLCANAALRVSPTGMDCPACATDRKDAADATPDPRVCAHCSRVSLLKHAVSQTVLLRDEHGRVKKYGFCRSHLRVWARTSTGYLTLDYVSRNVMNWRGNGLVLNPT